MDAQATAVTIFRYEDQPKEACINFAVSDGCSR